MKSILNPKLLLIIIFNQVLNYHSIVFCQNQQKIGESNTFGHNYIQYWQTVNSISSFCDYFNSVEGEIHSIHKNSYYPPFQDGDWCIFIKRWLDDPNFQGIITNSAGEVNEDGMIELEINTPFPLGNYFSVGMPLTALGWWVEDFGHSAEDFDTPSGSFLFGGNGKTELHPIINLRVRGINRVKYFAAQDISERFITSYIPIPPLFPFCKLDKFYITIPLPNFPVVNLSYSEYIGVPSSKTLRITENSIVDYVYDATDLDLTANKLLDEINKRQTSIQIYRNESNIEIAPFLPPLVSLSGSDLNSPIYLVNPFYYSDIYWLNESLLKEEINSFIRTNPINGLQSLQFIVTAELGNSADVNIRPIEWSFWKYDNTDIWGQKIEMNEENPIENKVRFNIEYSPAMGMNETEWFFELNAQNRPISWTPGKRSSVSETGIISVQERSIFREKRTYKITPSSLELRIRELKSPIDFGKYYFDINTGKVLRYWECVTGYRLQVVKHLVHPSVTYSGINWNLNITSNGVTTPTIFTINSGEIKEVGSVSLELDEFGEILTIQFKNEVPSTDFGYCNLSYVIVTADYTTSIGEHLIVSKTITPPKCNQPPNPKPLYDRELFENLLIALIIFDEQNIIINNNVLEDEWSLKLRTNWPLYGDSSLLNKDKISQLPTEYRSLIGEYIKKTTGLQSEDSLLFSEILQNILNEVKKLPQVDFKQPSLYPFADKIELLNKNNIQQLNENQRVDIGTITFSKNNTLSTESQENLLILSKQLKTAPEIHIKIYFDQRKSKEISLIQRRIRANKVKRFLIHDGVGKNQILVKGLKRDVRSDIKKIMIFIGGKGKL